MAAVGFDLYTRMLAEAVEEEKAVLEDAARQARPVATVIDLPVDAYLPDDYVPEEPQKLELYRRLGRVATERELDTIRDEMLDRYGPLPASVARLLDVARLRLAAEVGGHHLGLARRSAAGDAFRRGLVAIGRAASAGARGAGRSAAGRADRRRRRWLEPGAPAGPARQRGRVADHQRGHRAPRRPFAEDPRRSCIATARLRRLICHGSG